MSWLNLFKSFFTDEMIQNLVTETNRYATQHGPDQNWSNTNRDEISAFLGASIFKKAVGCNSLASIVIVIQSFKFFDIYRQN